MSEQAEEGQGNTGAGEGSEATSFLDGIQNEELKGNELLSSYNEEGKGLEALAQDFIELKGSQPVIPENVDGYVFDLPEDVQVDEAGMEAFKEIAHEAKLSPEQYKAVVGYRLGEINMIAKAVEDSKSKAMEDLKADPDFGGDNFEGNLEKAQKLLLKYDAMDILGEDANLVSSADDAKDLLGNKTGLFKLLVSIANDFSEDHFETGGGNQGGDKRELDDAGKPVLKFKM